MNIDLKRSVEYAWNNRKKKVNDEEYIARMAVIFQTTEEKVRDVLKTLDKAA